MRIFAVICLLATFPLSQSVSEEITKVGEFKISSTAAALVGKAAAHNFEQIIPSHKPMEWAVYVPDSYDPEVPAGILVFISAGNSGKIPNEWKAIMDRRNLIWVGANRSGNKIATSLRVTYAIFAPTAIGEKYKIDTNRVYVSGFSGGGRVSSMVAAEYAHIFKGAIFNSGANFWGNENPKHYNEIKKNHYVFITGTKDFNLRDTKRVYNAYKKAEIPNIKLLVIPFMSHQKPSIRIYEEAITFLDSRVTN